MTQPLNYPQFPSATDAFQVRGTLSKDCLVAEALDAWFEFYRPGQNPTSYETTKGKLRSFRQWYGKIKLKDITRDHVAEYVTRRMKEGIMGNTLSYRLKMIRRFFRWCIEDELIQINPVQFSRLPVFMKEGRQSVPFTWDQYQRLLRYLDSTPPRRGRAFWPSACIIAWHTGLRCSDIASLRWEIGGDGSGASEVRFDDSIIVVHPMKKRRRRERLEIPMEPELYDHLLLLWNKRHDEGESAQEAILKKDSPYVLPYMHFYYFQDRKGLIMSFRETCDAVNLPQHSFHSFRHGFVSRLLNSGIDPIIIGSMTGQCPDQIRSYSHVTAEARSCALETVRKALQTARLQQQSALARRALPGEVV